MNFRAARIEYYLDMILVLIASPKINQFVIGYTVLQTWAKSGHYRGKGFKHLIILEDKMTRAEALALERAIQTTILKQPKSHLYPKYHWKKRDKAYYPSAGGVKGKADESIHSVYMAWF